MSRRLVVGPSAPTRLAGDSSITVDLAIDLAGEGDPSWFVGQVRHAGPTGLPVVEVVVDGWRFELEVEDERRSILRGRATVERDAAAASGPTEIRAIIPGRIAAIRVAVGDTVEEGQAVLVVEAMKMQNELRAPRAGTIERVAVAEHQTIDNGDLLVVIA